MENYHIFFYVTLLLLTFTLSLALWQKTRETKKLKKQLRKFTGQSDDEIYNRGKFTELGLMSAGITHEISNPLSIILGRITQLMRMDLTPEKKPEFEKGLNQIKMNAERITSIIQSVREYIYRNDEQTEDFISLKEIINGVLVFFGQRLKNHGIELRIKNVENIYVSGHKGQFEQALLNLVSNSFDAIDSLKDKWIEISAVKNNNDVQIFVKDSGQGVSKEVQEKMLEPFYTTKKNKGSGLGLSLVKGIAQKHGGDLKYIEDKNTTFMLQIPQATSMHYHH